MVTDEERREAVDFGVKDTIKAVLIIAGGFIVFTLVMSLVLLPYLL